MKRSKSAEQSSGDSRESTGRSIILPIVFCLICGVLLILLKSDAVTITAYVLAGVLVLCGLWAVIVYIRSTPSQRISGSSLAVGLILLVAGVLLALTPKILNDLLPKIWGLALLFGGFLKIQYAFDEKTVSIRKWWIMLILAAFSIVIGLLSLLEPAFLGADDAKCLAIGIMLVAEAVLDIIVFFLLKYALMKNENEKAAAILASADAPSPDEPEPSGDEESSGESEDSGRSDASVSEEPEESVESVSEAAPPQDNK